MSIVSTPSRARFSLRDVFWLVLLLSALSVVYANVVQPRMNPSVLPVSFTEQGVPIASDGSLWEVCPEGKCMSSEFSALQAMEMPEDSDSFHSYSIIHKSDIASRGVSLPFVSSANAQDGRCTVIAVYVGGAGWVFFYDPNDPDCPPGS